MRATAVDLVADSGNLVQYSATHGNLASPLCVLLTFFGRNFSGNGATCMDSQDMRANRYQR